MKLVIITGLSGSGKTTYCKNNFNMYLSYDNVINYSTNSLNYKKIDEYVNSISSSDIILDAYNIDLLIYLIEKYNIKDVDFIFLYTNIENYYYTYASCIERSFILDKLTYDVYIEMIVKNQILILNAINNIILNKNIETEYLKYLKPEIVNINIKKYIYRKQSEFNNPIIKPGILNNTCEYIEYTNDNHFNDLYLKYMDNIDIHKQKYILDYIDKISGAKDYQSIILNDKYIRKGTEKDWITLDNILKCTSLNGKIVMDIGCFNGYFSFMFVKNGAKKVVGIDNNDPALKICNLLAIMNNYYEYKNGNLIKDNSSELGINFYKKTIGVDNLFDNIQTDKIDIIFALNVLHHVKRILGTDAFKNSVDSLFKNSNEVIFEINEAEMDDIIKISDDNNFTLQNKIESHRKTMFGDRWVLYFKKNN